MAYPTLNSFQDLISKNGISSSNIYDINFGRMQTSGSSDLFKNIKLKYGNDKEEYNPAQWLQFYTDEVSLPGQQVTTGTYKINNSPAYSYATDIIYPEVNITFILDAYVNQKKIFEKWLEYIKPIATDAGFRTMRLRYRDDYVSDITIEKYERYGNGLVSSDTRNKEVIPVNKGSSKAFMPNNLPKYKTILHNAFPITISSIQLNSGSSQLNRVSVTFRYEYPIYSSTNNVFLPKLEPVL